MTRIQVVSNGSQVLLLVNERGAAIDSEPTNAINIAERERQDLILEEQLRRVLHEEGVLGFPIEE